MKKLLTLLSFALTFNTVVAQLRLPVGTNPEVKDALEKVISDYPSGFAKLKGQVISEDPQTIEYASKLKLTGAEGNSILRHSGDKPIYTWQAAMPGTEDFEEASKKYRTLYNQLKLTSLKLTDGYTFTLAGEYDAPSEQKKFCASLFTLSPSAANFPKLRIELSLQYEFPEWKMFLAVYEKEREDDEPGKTREF